MHGCSELHNPESITEVIISCREGDHLFKHERSKWFRVCRSHIITVHRQRLALQQSEPFPLLLPYPPPMRDAGHEDRIYSCEMHVGSDVCFCWPNLFHGGPELGQTQVLAGAKVGRQYFNLVDRSTACPLWWGWTSSTKMLLISKYKPDLFSEDSPLPPLQHKQSY